MSSLDVAPCALQDPLMLDVVLVVFFAWSAGYITFMLLEARVCIRSQRLYRLRWWWNHEEVNPRWVWRWAVVNLVLTLGMALALWLGLYDLLDSWLS